MHSTWGITRLLYEKVTWAARCRSWRQKWGRDWWWQEKRWRDRWGRRGWGQRDRTSSRRLRMFREEKREDERVVEAWVQWLQKRWQERLRRCRHEHQVCTTPHLRAELGFRWLLGQWRERRHQCLHDHQAAPCEAELHTWGNIGPT